MGRQLDEGDCVAYPEQNSLSIGTIIKINPKMIKVQKVGSTGYWARGTNKYPNDVVKLDSADVTLYLLKHTK
jgi:hypothetical protein